MFARTARLMLRPAWPEDAPALSLLGSVGIDRTDPTPRGAAGDGRPANELLVFRRTAGAPLLIGRCALAQRPSGGVELSCWITRSERGLGYATEAARALIGIAGTLGIAELNALPAYGNPAAERLLDKLGFAPAAEVASLQPRRLSLASGHHGLARIEPLAA